MRTTLFPALKSIIDFRIITTIPSFFSIFGNTQQPIRRQYVTRLRLTALSNVFNILTIRITELMTAFMGQGPLFYLKITTFRLLCLKLLTGTLNYCLNYSEIISYHYSLLTAKDLLLAHND